MQHEGRLLECRNRQSKTTNIGGQLMSTCIVVYTFYVAVIMLVALIFTVPAIMKEIKMRKRMKEEEEKFKRMCDISNKECCGNCDRSYPAIQVERVRCNYNHAELWIFDRCRHWSIKDENKIQIKKGF